MSLKDPVHGLAGDEPVYDKAIAQLVSLMEEARQRGDREVSSAALATAGADARPSSVTGHPIKRRRKLNRRR